MKTMRLFKSMISHLTLAAALSTLTANAHGGQTVEVWVTLTEPAVVGGATNQEAVKKQQQTVLNELRALGAAELGRVSLTRNAIAVSIDQAKLPEVKKLSGVRSVSPVRNIEREPPAPPVR